MSGKNFNIGREIFGGILWKFWIFAVYLRVWGGAAVRLNRKNAIIAATAKFPTGKESFCLTFFQKVSGFHRQRLCLLSADNELSFEFCKLRNHKKVANHASFLGETQQIKKAAVQIVRRPSKVSYRIQCLCG